MVTNSNGEYQTQHGRKTRDIHNGSDVFGIFEILHFDFPCLESHKQSRTQQKDCYCIQEYESYSSRIGYTIADVEFVMFVDTQFLRFVKG